MTKFKGYACLISDTQGIIIPKEVLAKAWEEYLKKGDLTVILNFDPKKPVGKIIPEFCTVDDKGLLVTVETNYAKGLGTNGLCNSSEYNEKDRTQVVKSLELFEVSIVERPLKGYEACKIEEVKEVEPGT